MVERHDGGAGSFGARLQAARRERGMAQRALASRAGIDFTYLSKLENDRLPPPAVPTILKLAAALAADPLPLLQARRPLPDELASLSLAQWVALWRWLVADEEKL